MDRDTDMEHSVILKLASKNNWEGNFFFLKQRYFLLCHGFVRTSVDLLSMSSGLVTEVINLHAHFKIHSRLVLRPTAVPGQASLCDNRFQLPIWLQLHPE